MIDGFSELSHLRLDGERPVFFAVASISVSRPLWSAARGREDNMKISVFTGPYLEDDDAKMFGLNSPRAFWKIIAFIHDDTGELCATGCGMNQEQSLPSEEEFDFGQFTSPQLGIATQVPIRSIERRTGISFGSLGSVDPLADDEESVV